MYSVVLAASMAFAPESADFIRARSAGCNGVVGRRHVFPIFRGRAGFAVVQAAPAQVVHSAPAKVVQASPTHFRVVEAAPVIRSAPFRRCPVGVICP